MGVMDHIGGILLLVIHFVIAGLLIWSSQSPELYQNTTNVTVKGSYLDTSKGKVFDTTVAATGCRIGICGEQHDAAEHEKRTCVEVGTTGSTSDVAMETYSFVGPNPPICGEKPDDKAESTKLLTIVPEFESAYVQEMGMSYNYDGEFEITAKTIMPNQCRDEIINDESVLLTASDVNSPVLTEMPTDDFWVPDKDCPTGEDAKKCKENICEHFFYEQQQSNGFDFLKYKDANEDMQSACWIPRKEGDIYSSSVGKDFVERSKLQVVVYPLKHDVVESSAKTAAAKVCSLTFIFSRKTAVSQGDGQEATFNGFRQNQKYLVCYVDVDSGDSAKKLFASKSDQITSTSTFEDEDIYQESRHLSIFWALHEHVDGYAEDGAWSENHFLDGQIITGKDGDGMTTIALSKVTILSDNDKAGVDEVKTGTFSDGTNVNFADGLYVKVECLHEICKQGQLNTDLEDTKLKWHPLAGDKINWAPTGTPNNAEIETVKRIKGSVFKLTFKAFTALANVPSGDYFVASKQSNLRTAILQDYQTFSSVFGPDVEDFGTAAVSGRIYTVSDGFKNNKWSTDTDVYKNSWQLGMKLQTLGEVCQWTRNLMGKTTVATTATFTWKEFASPGFQAIGVEGQLENKGTTSGYPTFFTRVDPVHRYVFQALHYAQTKEAYKAYDEEWEQIAKDLSYDIPNNDPKCDDPDLIPHITDELSDTEFGRAGKLSEKELFFNEQGFMQETHRFYGVALKKIPIKEKLGPARDIERCKEICEEGTAIHTANMILSICAIAFGLVSSFIFMKGGVSESVGTYNAIVIFIALALVITGTTLTWIDIGQPEESAQCAFENVESYINTETADTVDAANSMNRDHFIKVESTPEKKNYAIMRSAGILFGVSILIHLILIYRIMMSSERKFIYLAASDAFLERSGF